jgi:hypothetical protein
VRFAVLVPVIFFHCQRSARANAQQSVTAILTALLRWQRRSFAAMLAPYFFGLLRALSDFGHPVGAVLAT